MSNVQSNKLKFISCAYAIGTIFVVLGHSTPTGDTYFPKIVNDIRTFIYCFHMPLFFFIAGFLLKYTTDKNKRPYSHFIKKKTVRFLTPYFVFSAIGIFPKILLSEFVNDTVSFDWFYIFKAIFNPRENIWGHFWFLPTLLIIYVFSYFLLMSYKSKPVFGIILIFSFVIAIFPLPTNWLAINDICMYLLYFCIGILSCNCILKRRYTIFKPLYAVLSMVLAILFFAFFNSYYFFDMLWIKNLISVLIACLMLYTVLYVSVFLERKNCGILDCFEGKTFAIFIMSWPCQSVVEILMNRILHFNWYISVPCMFIAGLGLPLLFIWIYKKFKYQPKFLNLVLGINR